MKLKDFVVNSLPRVRGKKKSRGNPQPDASSKSLNDGPPRPPIRMSSSLSRESSVERSSHVAVADVNWRHTPPRMLQDEMGMVGATPYFATAPHPGMVMSQSAEGISSHSLAVMTSHGQPLDCNTGPYSQMTAISESAVNYSMPRGVVLQSQHHHRHSHKHDYHYVYHHHHHQFPPESSSSRVPLVESNHHQNRLCKVTPTTRKPEPGFLRKSFNSFKAMRKQRNSAKDGVVAVKTKPGDENGKCAVCPYPQLHAQTAGLSKPLDVRPAKPKRKGLKSLRKPKSSHDEQLDKSWFSDNDASNVSGHYLSDADLIYSATTQRPRFRECSVESCMSRLYGSQDGSCGTETEYRCLDSHSLSGYESDLPRSKAGRTRTRIKTNPWLPSPQPSLNLTRRLQQCDFRESREDVMTVDDDYPSMPRSASFDHQRPTTALSSFQTNSSKGRPVTRHRSLTPSDLRIALSLHKTPVDSQPSPSESTQTATHTRSGKNSMNDLSLPVPKPRPTSILSPSSEFVILADNIEQLANNISFEYEDMLDTTLERVPACQEDGKISIQELLTDEELPGSVKNNDMSFSSSSQANISAHSPDSGIGCLGSSDGDEIVMASALPSAQSPLPSSVNCQTMGSRTTSGKPCEFTESLKDSSHSGNEIHPSPFIQDQGSHYEFAVNPDSICGSFSSSSNAVTNSFQPSCFSSGSFIPDATSSMNDISDQTGFKVLKKGNVSELLENIISDAAKSLSQADNDTSDSNSTYLNDLRNNTQSTDTTFSQSQIQTCDGETIVLPPNIIRSDITTPLESPTENWNFDMCSLSQTQNDSGPKCATATTEGKEICPTNLGPREQSGYDKLKVLGRESDSKAVSTESMTESFVDAVDSATETNGLDLADASVQTDFNDDEFDSWHESPSQTLGNLCDEEFDALESTRRWLLTGNMQGSADTGYSSQPRDSQILMDDDECISSCDTNNENNPLTPQCQSVSVENISTSMHISSGAPSLDESIDQNVTNVNGSKTTKSKPKAQKDELVYNMFSGIESQFNDIFHQLWPTQNIPEKLGNKRDSSGSSTSTLISETIGTFGELCGFDERTPRNSGCEIVELKPELFENSEYSSGKKVSKKMKNNPNKEPDYVNVPRKGHSGKSNCSHSRSMAEHKHKDHSGNNKRCVLQSYPKMGPGATQRYRESNTSPFLCSKANVTGTERADYLEFLRDAPLSNTYIKRPLFLIPGFGPIDMSSTYTTSLNRVANDDWSLGSSSQRQTHTKAKSCSRPAESDAVHRVNSLISEGRSGARSKRTQHKGSLDSALVCSSSSKNCGISQETSSSFCRKDLPDKPKRKNPRIVQNKSCSSRSHRMPNCSSEKPDQDTWLRAGSPLARYPPHQSSLQPDTSTRSLAERVWKLQREKDLIYLQLKEVQQEELSRHRQQLQHHRNVHSQRKDVLLETLRELKANLEEQSRKLNLACNKDVYI